MTLQVINAIITLYGTHIVLYALIPGVV